MRTKTFLICYDIHDKTRLRRVHKAVCDFGISVQLSVFKAELDQKKLAKLVALLKSLIKPNIDSVDFYPLNPKDTISLGVAPLSDDELII